MREYCRFLKVLDGANLLEQTLCGDYMMLLEGVNGLVWINAMCERLTTCWKSCWFSGKGHLCCFLWPSRGCDCHSTPVSLRITLFVCLHIKYKRISLSQHFNEEYVISIFTQFWKWANTSHYAEPIKNTLYGEKKPCSLSPSGGIPSQWLWPHDLLLFALVTAFCQYNVHNSGAHQQPRTVQSPGWSAWTKSKQITFPAGTDLQLTDRTTCQRMTSTQHKDMSHPYPSLLIVERVKSLRGRFFSWSQEIRLMPPPSPNLVPDAILFMVIGLRSHASGDTAAILGDKSASCRCGQVASFPATSPSELIMAEVSPCLRRGSMVSTISAVHPGDGGRVAPSWAAAEGTIITVMSLWDRCRSELLIFWLLG